MRATQWNLARRLFWAILEDERGIAKSVPGVHRHSQFLSSRRNEGLYFEEEGATCPSKALQISICDRFIGRRIYWLRPCGSFQGQPENPHDVQTISLRTRQGIVAPNP